MTYQDDFTLLTEFLAQLGSEVYAMSEGNFTFARLFFTMAWGNVLVIDHGTVDGLPRSASSYLPEIVLWLCPTKTEWHAFHLRRRSFASA